MVLNLEKMKQNAVRRELREEIRTRTQLISRAWEGYDVYKFSLFKDNVSAGVQSIRQYLSEIETLLEELEKYEAEEKRHGK